jgi:hypothetical protein
VCGRFAEALRRHGLPQEILTDNSKVFTGRFAAKDIEVLFDRICRENGISVRLDVRRGVSSAWQRQERLAEDCDRSRASLVAG